MVTLVEPQSQPQSSTTKVSENAMSAFAMPTDSSTRLALITPSLCPREPISSPSPVPMEFQKPTTLSVAMPEVETASETVIKPEEASEG